MVGEGTHCGNGASCSQPSSVDRSRVSSSKHWGEGPRGQGGGYRGLSVVDLRLPADQRAQRHG